MLAWGILIWLVLINLVAFVAVWRDKRIAKLRERQAPDHQTRRISERTLFGLGLLGGVWGLMLGMRRFRHKTRKVSFLVITTLIFLANLGYYYAIAFYVPIW